jgi:ribonuclease HI
MARKTNLTEVNQAGRLQNYIVKWKSITTDKMILQAVVGYKIPFIRKPIQLKEPHCMQLSPSDKLNVDGCIEKLLRSKAIEIAVDESEQFVSTIFVVPKTDGSSRLVINLRKLNEYVDCPHFKMEDIRTAIPLISKNCFLAVLDVKDAYHMIPIHPNDRKFLRFRWNGILYQYTCVPFGLNVAPRLYTKIMKPVLAHLRSNGFKSVSYLDDCLCMGDTEGSCKENVDSTDRLYKELGILVNYEKSQVVPSHCVRYLGFILDTEHMVVRLPDSKRKRVLDHCKSIRNRVSVKIIELAGLIGTLISVCPAIMYGQLYTRTLEYDKSHALARNAWNFEAVMIISEESREDLDWWISNLPTSVMPISKSTVDFQLTTDASLTGWGAEMNGLCSKGCWSAIEKSYHINQLELMAIFNGLQAFSFPSHCQIMIRTDNTTALSYINRFGGCRATKCHAIAKLIWQWCEAKYIFIKACYIPSKQNIIADSLSRSLHDSSDFMLSQQAFSKIVKWFGEPSIDYFASSRTKQCYRFASWQPDVGATLVDAFTVSWTGEFFYAFPPFNQIIKVLNKIKSESCEGVVVVPDWPTQPWYPMFQELAMSRILKLRSKSLLFCPYDCRPHPLSKQIGLLAAILSSSNTKP